MLRNVDRKKAKTAFCRQRCIKLRPVLNGSQEVKLVSTFFSRRVPHKRGDLAPTLKTTNVFGDVSVKLSLLSPKITLQIPQKEWTWPQ
jgi:hypothetical protein